MKNLKKYSIVGFFILLGLGARSQELLNLNKSRIKKIMAGELGILENDRIVQDGINPGPYNYLFFSFPEPVIRKNDIYNISFLLMRDKCYRYILDYGSDRFLKDLTDKFNNPKSELKRVGKELKWINTVKKYEIEILMVKRVNGEGKEVKTTSFMLDIHNEK